METEVNDLWALPRVAPAKLLALGLSQVSHIITFILKDSLKCSLLVSSPFLAIIVIKNTITSLTIVNHVRK